MTRLAQLAEAKATIRAGGFLRFVWKTGRIDLVAPDGSVRTLDGRTYDAIRTHSGLLRTESGSTDDGTLVINWRQR